MNPPEEKGGWLLKYSRTHAVIGNWRRRYMYLSFGTIVYYKDKDRKIKKGSMSLNGSMLKSDTKSKQIHIDSLMNKKKKKDS